MATTTPIELTRHFSELSEEETVELVEAVAVLIVDFIRQRGVPPCTPQRTQELSEEVRA